VSRVVVVTGGGNGIGAAVAAECKRQGWYVVTVDPMVSLDGSEKVAGAPPGAGDRAVDLSVTDADGVRALFESLAEEFGRLDAVINVAGISRPTSYTRGTDEDWRAVLEVHLTGHRNVVGAALPLMREAGYGRILAVTSGSGWRAADTGAYGCAKRAVASLTWDLGRSLQGNVALNAISPIAVTRMVTAALGRAPSSTASSSTGGLNLGAMPQPEEIGPLAAHLIRDEVAFRGEIVFAGGTEVAIVQPPQLLEAVTTIGASSLPHLLAGITPAWVQAAERQTSGGGSNPRFGEVFAREGELGSSVVHTCAVASDRPEVAAAITRALETRKIACLAATGCEVPDSADAVVVALASSDDIVGGIYDDACWTRAAQADRPLRLVTVTDAANMLGHARAQASVQLARSARKATEERVIHYTVSDEGADSADLADIVAHLVCDADARGLAGNELAAGPGWFGLRSHPRVAAAVSLGSTAIPAWLDDVLGQQ
jgi:NAD(P)-dependent dehydrogenase (short-subunit alcohol dehydrogenase family)